MSHELTQWELRGGYHPSQGPLTDMLLWWLRAYEHDHAEAIPKIFGASPQEVSEALDRLEEAGKVWALELAFRAGWDPYRTYFSCERRWRLVPDGSVTKSRHRRHRGDSWTPRHVAPCFKLLIDGDVVGRVMWRPDGGADRWEVREPKTLSGRRHDSVAKICRDIHQGIDRHGQGSLFGRLAG